VHNETALPNITLKISDGSGPPVLVSPLVTFFDTQHSNGPSVPLGAVIGSVAGAAAIGLAVFGIFKLRQCQTEKVQQQISTIDNLTQ